MIETMQRPIPAFSTDMLDRKVVTTYRDLCAEVGVVNPAIVIDDLKYFLNAADMPVFDLAGVVAFMNDLTARDNPSKLGWEWRPVRAAGFKVRCG